MKFTQRMVNINHCFVIMMFLDVINGLILSKSKIQICENRGLHGQGDPKNLVYGKSCERKLVVLMSITNNQKEGTEKLHATVSRVRDETTNEYARLYNPFMITISKSPVLLNYPYFYTGYSVNNRPYEEVRMTRGSWWASDSSKQCYDQWQHVEKSELRPTCGYQYMTRKIKNNDGTIRDEKSRIWDSQGFCCHCSGEEKMAHSSEEAKNYKRSGLVCKLFTRNTQASAHCMRMDQLWYTVHSFSESYRDFNIHVKAYDQIEKVVKNKTVIDYVNGGEIILSPSQKSGVGKYQRIIAHYVGDFAPIRSYPVLTERYFLIPREGDGINLYSHPQTKDGVSNYLILPMNFFDLRGGACNKIGVSYSSFKSQSSSGQGYGCQQKKGYCLMNQPYHFFQEDKVRLASKKTPLWFPMRYGKLSGTKKVKNTMDELSNTVLSFELQEDHVSLVTLQISADDIIFIYNRASGEIVRAAIRDFEALSLDGKLQVEILNTGYVTASFYLGVPECSEGIDRVEERSASIDPQSTQKFVFNLHTSKREGATFHCIVQLYDAKRELLARRNISFSTSTPCTCEVMACKCECLDSGGVRCIEMEGKYEVSTKVYKANKASGGMFDSIGGFFSGLVSLPLKLFSGLNSLFSGLFGAGLWQMLRWVFLGVIFIFVMCIFLNCGGPQLFKMCFKKRKWFKSKKSKNTTPSSSEESISKSNKKKNKMKKLKYADNNGDDNSPVASHIEIQQKARSYDKTTRQSKSRRISKAPVNAISDQNPKARPEKSKEQLPTTKLSSRRGTSVNQTDLNQKTKIKKGEEGIPNIAGGNRKKSRSRSVSPFQQSNQESRPIAKHGDIKNHNDANVKNDRSLYIPMSQTSKQRHPSLSLQQQVSESQNKQEKPQQGTTIAATRKKSRTPKPTTPTNTN